MVVVVDCFVVASLIVEFIVVLTVLLVFVFAVVKVVVDLLLPGVHSESSFMLYLPLLRELSNTAFSAFCHVGSFALSWATVSRPTESSGIAVVALCVLMKFVASSAVPYLAM